jgi:hypothetical protein
MKTVEDEESNLLTSERQRLERELGKKILAIGLFRRVYSAGCLGILVVLAAMYGLYAILTKFGHNSNMNNLLCVLLIYLLLKGLFIPKFAVFIRKAKRIPDDFAAVLTADRIHFHEWSFNDKTKVVTLASEAASWPRSSLKVSTDDVTVRRDSAPIATRTSNQAIRFLLDKEGMFYALAMSVIANKDGSGASVVEGSQQNEAFELLMREHIAKG